jgi:multiple sugar transport system ATP-binding protein
VLQQLAPPGELYEHPVNLFVARFCGSPPMNVLSGEVDDRVFRHAQGTVPLSGSPPLGAATLGFRPEHAALVEPGTEGSLAGELYVVEPLGNETLVAIQVGDELLNVRVAAGYDAPIGTRCGVLPTAGHLHLFDPQTEASVPDIQAPQEGALHESEH